jgi:hypothetical protein
MVRMSSPTFRAFLCRGVRSRTRPNPRNREKVLVDRAGRNRLWLLLSAPFPFRNRGTLIRVVNRITIGDRSLKECGRDARTGRRDPRQPNATTLNQRANHGVMRGGSGVEVRRRIVHCTLIPNLRRKNAFHGRIRLGSTHTIIITTTTRRRRRRRRRRQRGRLRIVVGHVSSPRQRL